jgi:hypothetical protein
MGFSCFLSHHSVRVNEFAAKFAAMISGVLAANSARQLSDILLSPP